MLQTSPEGDNKHILAMLTLLHLDDVFSLANHDKMAFQPDGTLSGKLIKE